MRLQLMVSVLALLTGLALLAAACAPAAKPAPQPAAQPQAPSGQAPATAAPKAQAPKAEAPKAISPGVVVPQQTVTTEKPGVKTSVSGIPLDPDAKFGGTLRLAYGSEGPTFSIWEESAGVSYKAGQPITNMLVQIQTWGTLEDYNKGAYLNIRPDLATSWEQSKDGLQWTFKLREGVKWTDGKPFTCADAKWSFDTIRTGTGLRRSPRATHFLAVQEIQCADDRTLVFKMKRPKPAFLEVVAMAYHVVLPKHRYDGKTDDMRNKPWDTGTGPFVNTGWIPSEKYTFAKKTDYWDKPFPYIDGIELLIISSTAEDTGLRAGRIDMGGFCCYNGQRAENLVRECTVCQAWPPLINNDIGVGVVINQQRAPWNGQDLKEAVSLAIDRVKFAKVAGQDWILPAVAGPYQPGTYWAMPYERVKQYPGYNIDTPEENKQKAREILKNLGYKPGELELPLGVWNTPSVVSWQPALIEDLQSVGFKVRPILLTTAAHYDVLISGDYDIRLHNYWVSHIDPDVVLYENYYTGSDRNYQHYANPKVDRLTDEMSVTLDKEERRQKAWAIGDILLKEQALLNLGHYKYQVIYAGRVKGLLPAWGIYNGYGPINRHDKDWLAETK